MSTDKANTDAQTGTNRTDEPLLSVQSINARYGESKILRELSLAVEEGTICALLGRNGAGKTTTLRSIAGAKPPSVEGTISFRGTDITGNPTEDIAMKGISLVPEERRIFSDLTVEENLHLTQVSRNTSNVFGRDLGELRDTRPLEGIYEIFPRLDERRGQAAGTLSGGEQQMLAIARALRANPDLLMLDEPYEGLAPQIVDDVEETIEQINEAGTTILLVEQNAVAAISVADSCYIINQGEMVFDGSAQALKEDEETRERYLSV